MTNKQQKAAEVLRLLQSPFLSERETQAVLAWAEEVAREIVNDK